MAEPASFGITREQAMRRFHVRDAQGRWQSGAWAFVELWTHLPYFPLAGASGTDAAPGAATRCRLRAVGTLAAVAPLRPRSLRADLGFTVMTRHVSFSQCVPRERERYLGVQR